ncbi:glycosyltransferase family 39 protein [Nocardia otitidiscaviarum]|uniref:Glycosyltransferase family 39 protein n=1 Tax=Nocardia otitidiscaviarum TaxID=1823 RepID=A0A516NVH8_9NOCA|nr:glycosyltransferase family 39 protein [Nocardia otitidiscaviarum]MCP9622390.1 glycosyltransferase family 39 protein [Nocardia otitidiscaviarum]QDP82916.1 glycosyltransferase family 39 protein [Nocardia otitidiscaviarum]
MTAILSRPRHAAEAPAPRTPHVPRWDYPALAVLLVGTALAYLWNLTANGWANSFYAAAVQAGSRSWKAFFFGSSDAANSITVDKTPLSLWPMEISVRIFGLHSWSMLLPQVLLGVGSVALLWAAVRRHFGPGAGLLAGLALAVTPVAALMFRFDNPDAMLVFLMVAAAWAMLRAVESGRWKWLLLCGLFIGLGFLAKQLQVLLVLPALALTYLIAGPPQLGKRIAQLFAAGVAMVAGAGWWVLIAQLWPADDRPYFGGSQNNSIIELTLGYNGLGRLNGEETGSVGPGGELPAGGNGIWGSTGITRLFEPAQGGQIAWLIPAALMLSIAGIALRGRASRTDPQRAALLLWGGWLLVTGLVFSFMRGIFHQYYTVALAPAVAALVGAGAVQLWRRRELAWVRVVLALTVGLTTATAWMLLSRSADFVPWLRWAILIGGIAATVLMLVPARRLSLAAASLALTVGLAGPVAYTVDTLASAHQGAIPTAGPDVGGGFGPGHDGPGGRQAMDDGRTDGAAGGGTPAARNGGQLPPPGGGAAPPGTDGTLSSGATDGAGAQGNPGATGGGLADGAPGAGPAHGAMGGGPASGIMGASEPSERLTALLLADGDAYTWVAATVSSNSAAGYQLATELPVMPVGGFNGSDPSPTLEQFQRYVAEGRIHYFLTGSGNGGGPGRSADSESSRITAWIAANFTAEEVDGVTVYDLTKPTTA